MACASFNGVIISSARDALYSHFSYTISSLYLLIPHGRSGTDQYLCPVIACFMFLTDRSKAVVLVLCGFAGFSYRAFHVESCLALCSRVFQSF